LGAKEIYDLVQDVIHLLHEEQPDEVPDVTLPPIEQRSSSVGELFTFELPPHLGVDSQIAACVGVTNEYAVLTTSSAQVERVFNATPLQLDGPMARHPEKLISAGQFRFAGLIEAIQPWIRYGFSVAARANEEEGGSVAMDAIQGQVETICEVLKCYRGSTTLVYPEKGAIVTHSESHFEDLPQ
jgi:hypothetical protein